MKRYNPTRQSSLLKKQKIVVILGPTTTGKSALAVTLARHFNGEVISTDSRQVYKGLNIGTGKITKSETRGVPHHLLDVVSPRKQFSVAEYQKIAGEKIAEIFSRGKLPIICGGTGFYIDTLLNNRTLPEVPPNYALRKKLEKKSAHELFALLKKLNPQRAKTIDQKNSRRLIRAIEIATALGKIPPHRKVEPLKVQPFGEIFWIGLTLSPEKLKKKINIRLFSRISRGMVNEAKKLHKQGLSWKRMEELGLEYRYLAFYLQHKITKQETIEKLKTEIWQYAKRQMTWFKRNKQIQWFNPSESKKIKRLAKKFLDSQELSYVL